MKTRNNRWGAINVMVALICIAAMANVGSVTAQDHFSIQVRPGLSFATTGLGDANLKTGFGFEFNVGYRFMTHVLAYAGWGMEQIFE